MKHVLVKPHHEDFVPQNVTLCLKSEEEVGQVDQVKDLQLEVGRFYCGGDRNKDESVGQEEWVLHY